MPVKTGFVLTDMHGCRGVVVKDKTRARPKGFTFASLFKLWPTRN